MAFAVNSRFESAALLGSSFGLLDSTGDGCHEDEGQR